MFTLMQAFPDITKKELQFGTPYYDGYCEHDNSI
jgi:hypothetical protein